MRRGCQFPQSSEFGGDVADGLRLPEIVAMPDLVGSPEVVGGPASWRCGTPKLVIEPVSTTRSLGPSKIQLVAESAITSFLKYFQNFQPTSVSKFDWTA